MSQRKLRIRVDGRIDGETAMSLGAEAEQHDADHELVFELVFDYIDQAQLTGVLLQLSDLHISYDRIEILEDQARSEPTQPGSERGTDDCEQR